MLRGFELSPFEPESRRAVSCLRPTSTSTPSQSTPSVIAATYKLLSIKNSGLEIWAKINWFFSHWPTKKEPHNGKLFYRQCKKYMHHSVLLPTDSADKAQQCFNPSANILKNLKKYILPKISHRSGFQPGSFGPHSRMWQMLQASQTRALHKNIKGF